MTTRPSVVQTWLRWPFAFLYWRSRWLAGIVLRLARPGGALRRRFITPYEAARYGRALLVALDGRRQVTRFDFPVRLVGFLGPNGPGSSVLRLCRRIAFSSTAVIKLRELQSVDRTNHVARLDGPVEQKTLRNLVAWHRHVKSEYPDLVPIMAFHLVVKQGRGFDDPRLIDLVSFGTLLGGVCNVAVCAGDEFPGTMVDLGLRKDKSADDEFDLDKTPSLPLLAILNTEGCGETFDLQASCRKKLNDVMKVAAPGDFSVAFSIGEGPSGVPDPQQFALWLPVLERLRADRQVTFCLLNRFSEKSAWELPKFILPMQSMGFSFCETVGIAQSADFYLGVLDAFGLVALGAKRPGAYAFLDQVEGAGRTPARLGVAQWRAAADCTPDRLAALFCQSLDEWAAPALGNSA